MQRYETGIEGLDTLLQGGVPELAMILVYGAPGTGKSVLAQTMAYNLAARGGRCAYFTALAEPSLKMLRALQSFDFFNPDYFNQSVNYYALGEILRQTKTTNIVDHLTQTVESIQPSLVVIDSLKALLDALPEGKPRAQVCRSLVLSLTAAGCTSLATGSYPPPALYEYPEFTVADGLIRLELNPGSDTPRTLALGKLRGSSYQLGQHPFTIDERGFQVELSQPVASETSSPKLHSV